jgi:hypothetical protein
LNEKASRNDPCPCGSGKKYKKCCFAKDAESEPSFVPSPERGTPDDVEVGGEPLDFGDEPLDRLGIHPYAVQKFAAHEKLSGGIKRSPGFLTPAEVAALPLDKLAERLQKIGIDPAREKFLELAAKETSAWKVGDAWLDALGGMPSQQDLDFVGLAACELWKRWSPERPSIELLDDWIDEGYEDIEENSDPADAAQAWLRPWKTIQERLAPGMRTFEAAKDVYDCSYNLGEWIHDVSMAFVEGSEDSPELAQKGIELLSRVIAQFPDEDRRSLLSFACDRADLLFEAGRDPEALAAYEALLKEHATEAAGFVRFAEVLLTRDPKRSVELFKQAKKKKGAKDWGIPERLEEANAIVADQEAEGGSAPDSSK